jgi:DNA-binding NtrC family response regulator
MKHDTGNMWKMETHSHNMKKTILIIDDKVKLCETLARTFDQLGYQTFYATNGKDAVRLFSQLQIHGVLLDIMLGEENGIDVLKQLLLLRKNIPVIMITGYASVDTAVQSLKLGAFDYVKKPLDLEQLVKVVENAIQISTLSEENQQLKNHLIEKLLPRIITQNARMLEVCDNAKKLAVTDLPILISGENGTGKEIMADFVHMHSPRNSRRMLKINCASFPETLLDNELFGHEKGAYTGANALFKGVFERAHKSSLFLDEIGDMPFSIQAKILRTLQNHELRRLGGTATITVDVRFIAATNKNLEKLIREERFREDLLYRLNTAVIHIPPLRERKEDIPLLVEHFLSDHAQTNSTRFNSINDAVRERFFHYHWPGNVRELKNVINYAAAVSSKESIDLDDLPPNFPTTLQQDVSETPGNIREEMEKNLIIKMLQKTDYNKKKTAEILNMSRKTLYSRLRKYGISTPK